MAPRISAAELVEHAVLEGKGRVVSTSDLIFSIRRTIPDCEHTDNELTQLIAAIAIQHGCNVSFGDAPPPMDVAEAAIGRRRSPGVPGLLRAADNDDGFREADRPAVRSHAALPLAR